MRKTLILVGTMLSFCSLPACVRETPPVQHKVEGTWQGTLKAEGLELRVVFKISRKPEGTLTATIDSPNQGSFGIPVDEATFENGNLYLESKRIQGVFEGKIKENGSTIEGQWKQQGQVLPLIVKRVDEAPKIHRLQESEKSYGEPEPPPKESNHPDYAKLIPPEKLKEDLDFLFKTIEEVHPNMYAYTTKEEFTPLRDELYKQVDRPMTRLEFYKLTAPVVASLKSGHTRILPPPQEFKKYVNKGGKVFPLALRLENSNVVIVENLSHLDLAIGEKVLTINQEPACEVLKRIVRGFASEGRNAKNRIINPRGIERPEILRFLMWFEYGPLESWDVTIKTADGKLSKHTVKSIATADLKGNGVTIFKKENSYRDLPEYKTDLLEINSFVGDIGEFKEFLAKSFKEIKDKQISNLVIDIRENIGGNSALGDVLLNYLTNKPFRQHERFEHKISKQRCGEDLERIRNFFGDKNIKIGSIMTMDVPFNEPSGNPLRFTGRTFVLISQSTFSSGVSFASAVKCFKIAILIGEETLDTTTSYGDILPFNLPNTGLHLNVPYKYFVEACGKPDGRGVIPDYEVKQKPEDTAKGIDTVLQFTLDLIEKSSSKIPSEQKVDNQQIKRS